MCCLLPQASAQVQVILRFTKLIQFHYMMLVLNIYRLYKGCLSHLMKRNLF